MPTNTAPNLLIDDGYHLPDAELLNQPADGSGRFMIWIPDRVMIVVGKGSDPAKELNIQAIRDDGVPVIRRGSGGCAVVLSPKMIVISFAVYRKNQLKSSEYFDKFNRIIIRSLEREGVKGLSFRGTSDIALGDRKIGGTSLYRNRNLVYFHAVLNSAEGTEQMERYLRHPPREPDYRRQRSHSEFVTSLKDAGFNIDIRNLEKSIKTEFQSLLLLLPL